jgi:hypothetical protein
MRQVIKAAASSHGASSSAAATAAATAATPGEDDCDEASAGEWTEWLCWMVESIRARELELAGLKRTVADELKATTALEAEGDRLATAGNADLMKEQRELSTLIAVLVEHRQELKLYLEFVDDLSKEDIDRIEEMWTQVQPPFEPGTTPSTAAAARAPTA